MRVFGINSTPYLPISLLILTCPVQDLVDTQRAADGSTTAASIQKPALSKKFLEIQTLKNLPLFTKSLLCLQWKFMTQQYCYCRFYSVQSLTDANRYQQVILHRFYYLIISIRYSNKK